MFWLMFPEWNSLSKINLSPYIIIMGHYANQYERVQEKVLYDILDHHTSWYWMVAAYCKYFY